MAFHLLAYNGAQATTANTDVAPVTDNVVNIVNSHFFPQQDLRLIFAAGMGANITRARISQPSLRLVTLPFIRPLIDAATPASLDRVADFTPNPPRSRGLEELGFEVTSSSGTADCFGLYGVQDSYEAPPSGDVYTLRGTSSTAAVADTWTTLTMTWADQLPDGVYAVIGASMISANSPAIRLIFSGQTWRPGALCMGATTSIDDDLFRYGRLGVWGRFRQTDMPQPQVLCNTTTNSHEVYLDIVKVG